MLYVIARHFENRIEKAKVNKKLRMIMLNQVSVVQVILLVVNSNS